MFFPSIVVDGYFAFRFISGHVIIAANFVSFFLLLAAALCSGKVYCLANGEFMPLERL